MTALVAAVAAVVAAGLLGAGVPPAAAQANCPPGGTGAIQVDISEPADGATVSGVIRVKGQVQASLGVDITHVDVTMGLVATGGAYPPGPVHPFDFRLDTTLLPRGPITLRVVACNPRDVGALIARGTREITVVVDHPAPAAASPAAGSDGDRSEGAATPDPLVIREAPGDEKAGRPLWTGVVVGLSGALGLVIAALSWRRRGPAPEEGQEEDEVTRPDGPDLVPVE